MCSSWHAVYNNGYNLMKKKTTTTLSPPYYTSQLPTSKIVEQIEMALVEFGVTKFHRTYENKHLVGFTYEIERYGISYTYNIPVWVEGVYNAIMDDVGIGKQYKTRKQAERAAWGIMRDYIMFALTLVRYGIKPFESIFLDDMLDSNGTALGDALMPLLKSRAA